VSATLPIAGAKALPAAPIVPRRSSAAFSGGVMSLATPPSCA
jgi:hypothetical protein